MGAVTLSDLPGGDIICAYMREYKVGIKIATEKSMIKIILYIKTLDLMPIENIKDYWFIFYENSRG